jgi:hypothetical protein
MMRRFEADFSSLDDKPRLPRDLLMALLVVLALSGFSSWFPAFFGLSLCSGELKELIFLRFLPRVFPFSLSS